MIIHEQLVKFSTLNVSDNDYSICVETHLIQQTILFEIPNHYQMFHATNRDFSLGASDLDLDGGNEGSC